MFKDYKIGDLVIEIYKNDIFDSILIDFDIVKIEDITDQRIIFGNKLGKKYCKKTGEIKFLSNYYKNYSSNKNKVILPYNEANKIKIANYNNLKDTSERLLHIRTFLNKTKTFPIEKLPKIMNLVNELNDIIFGKKE